MKMKQIQLAPGMTLDAVRTDRFKTACLSMSTAVVSDRSRSPLDTLFLSVAGRGNAFYPTLRDLNRHMDALYDLTLSVRNYPVSSLQILGSGISFLDPAFLPPVADGEVDDRAYIAEENVRMLRDSIYAPLFGKDAESDDLFRLYTEKEKHVQIDQIRSEIDSPGLYAEIRARECAFRDEPYGVSLLGTEADVRKLCAEDLIKRYESFWCHTPLHFFYIGSSDAERVATLIRKAFQKPDGTFYTDGTLPRAIPATGGTSFKGEPSCFTETLPVTQGKLVLTFLTPPCLGTDALFPAMVMNELFGGSPASRLFLNVREKQGLCYSCSSSLDFYKGCITAFAGMKRENAERVKDAILLEAEALRLGKFGDRELENAKKSLMSVYTGLYDSASALEDYFVPRSYFGVSTTPEECIDGIGKVTKEDVVAFAKSVSLYSTYLLSGDMEEAEDPGQEEY